jgi:protein-tyrosine phosphatase
MIDLHCHILPGLDDGPATIEESLAMAEIAVADGITKIIATPHIQGPEPTAAEISEVTSTLNRALQEKDIGLEIIPAAEVYAMTAPTLLSDRTINKTKYVLIEFPLTHLPAEAGRVIFDLRVNGYRPIIAHPERIPNVIERPELIEALLDDQVYVQITAASPTGRFGPGPKKCARYLLANGLVDFLGSDGHSSEFRKPRLSDGLAAVGKIIGRTEALKLVTDNPAAVLEGREVENER